MLVFGSAFEGSASPVCVLGVATPNTQTGLADPSNADPNTSILYSLGVLKYHSARSVMPRMHAQEHRNF